MSAFSAVRRGSRSQRSSCRAAASGSEAPPCPRASLSHGRDNHCVALSVARFRMLAVRSAAQALGVELHQPIGGKADHLAQKRRVRSLLQQLAKRDPLIGRRGGLLTSVACEAQLYRRPPRSLPLWISSPPVPDSLTVAPVGYLHPAPTPSPGTGPHWARRHNQGHTVDRPYQPLPKLSLRDPARHRVLPHIGLSAANSLDRVLGLTSQETESPTSSPTLCDFGLHLSLLGLISPGLPNRPIAISGFIQRAIRCN